MTTTYRFKVARLRGILYSVKFAIEEKDAVELDDLLPQIIEILDETGDKPEDDLDRSMPWRPGSVAQAGEYVKLYEGQVWELAEDTMASDEEGHFDRTISYDVARLKVVSTSPDGEVHLRPVDEESLATIRKLYPEREFVKGERDVRPFKIVDEKMVKGSKGVLMSGDLLCHEAWDIWARKLVPMKWNDPAG